MLGKNPVGKKEMEAPIITADEIMKPSSERPKDGPKQKGVPSEPHPMDRRSGTGRGYLTIILDFRKEMRKGGQGKRNWGTYQDDMKYYGEDDVSHSEEEYEEEAQ